MADLFKLAGRDVRVAEADNVLNTFEQISLVDKTVQYNDNIEVTEIYLSCEGMESRYCWGGIVFMAPGSSAASNIKYYYNYMGQKTELTPTNAAELKNAIDADAEPIMVSIFNSESNPTITYIPNGLVEGRCYASSTDGDEPFHFYWYGTLTNYLPQLLEIAPDTSKFLDKGTSSTTATQTVYNPVELKKPLVAPAVKGEEFTISGGAQNTFTLGGSIIQESGKTLRQSQLILSGGTDSALYKSGIVQDANGHFFIIPKDSTNTANALWWTETNGWKIGDNRIVTYNVLSDNVTTLQSHIKGQADDWMWIGKVAEKVYSLDLSEIKPGASGTTTGATCYVSINTFRKRMSGKQLYKTVIDATCRCEPFELKHLDVKVLLSNVGSKWFMPRMFVSRGAMQSDAFTHMMAVLYADRAYVGMTVDECSVFRDMTTALGTLNASGSVSPIYCMNADGFSLFAAIVELDRDNENKNIPVSGAHYRVTIFHPNTIL